MDFNTGGIEKSLKQPHSPREPNKPDNLDVSFTMQSEQETAKTKRRPSSPAHMAKRTRLSV